MARWFKGRILNFICISNITVSNLGNDFCGFKLLGLCPPFG